MCNYIIINYANELANFGNMIIKFIRKIGNVKFRYIYVEIIDYIYRFDIKNDTYMIYPFSKYDAGRFGDIARKRVLDMRL